MRTRSGLTLSDVRAGISATRSGARYAGQIIKAGRRAVRKRRESRAVRPAEVRQIVQRTIASSTDKRVFIEVQSSLNASRVFTSQLLCSKIIQGTSNATRTGEKIHLRQFTQKFCLTHNGVVPAIPGVAFTNHGGLAAPVFLHMYLIRTNRSDDPVTYWFKDLASDGDVAYTRPRGEGTDQVTAQSDQNRFMNRVNTDDFKILKYKKVGVSGIMAQGDGFGCSHRQFSFTYKWKKPQMIQFNVVNGAAVPYLPTDLNKRFYMITFLSQGDTVADDTISTAQTRSVCYTYFTDN
jgi:hypothetical protein